MCCLSGSSAAERDEPPDIDIDFEHERREEVIQYIYGKYGRDRAGMTAEVITYRRRTAVREVGKALGLSLDSVDRLANGRLALADDEVDRPNLREAGLDPHDRDRAALVHLADAQMMGFPRHLSQHVGGFVITRAACAKSCRSKTPPCPTAPSSSGTRTTSTRWACSRWIAWPGHAHRASAKRFDLVAAHTGRGLTLATIPAEDQRSTT